MHRWLGEVRRGRAILALLAPFWCHDFALSSLTRAGGATPNRPTTQLT